MDIMEIVNLISSVGFPIVMCVMMYKYITDDSKQTREAIVSLQGSIKALEELISKLVENRKEVEQ